MVDVTFDYNIHWMFFPPDANQSGTESLKATDTVSYQPATGAFNLLGTVKFQQTVEGSAIFPNAN
jgi:hypothetical protein